MILTVTLNPALDLTYAVDELRPHATHRVRAVHERPGGKGLNVASVLHAQGEPVLATGLLGGSVGAAVRALVDAAGLPSAFVPIAGETRRTVTIAHGGDATGLWEPGPFVTAAEWSAFLACYGSLLSQVSVVTLSGSLPRGVPADAYAALIRSARARGVPCVLDASGEALRLGLAAGPDLIKPNAAELAELTDFAWARERDGRAEPRESDETGNFAINAHKSRSTDVAAESRGPRGPLGSLVAGTDDAAPGRHGPPHALGSLVADTDDPAPGPHGPLHAMKPRPGGPLDALKPRPARSRRLLDALRSLPAASVVASRGAQGLLAVTPDGCWQAAPPAALPGNPTGAGDACVAALARGLRDRTPWPELLADAVALSAAAVAAPVAGAVDDAEYRRIRPLINVEEYDDADANG
ncbi:1-phosphofructokinase family hexose kinase [Dactylosporangium darangshiense]|uniref:Carbohydrate kinase PfkB domain-containing protein n=1 Tax=Dactylosporangium darangshiense TaxID=579108 RepID=A0ABP8D2D3_9ACTN